jgi:hypothetical protein
MDGVSGIHNVRREDRWTTNPLILKTRTCVPSTVNIGQLYEAIAVIMDKSSRYITAA